MAEYIDREAFLEAIERMKPYHQEADDIAEMLQNFPAANVRPVVLCRDCIHLSGVTNGGSFFRCDRYDRWQDESNRVYMPLDGFCCYGQKNEEER